MCGYVNRFVSPRVLRELLSLLGMQLDKEEAADNEPVMRHFYPAFGGRAANISRGSLPSVPIRKIQLRDYYAGYSSPI